MQLNRPIAWSTLKGNDDWWKNFSFPPYILEFEGLIFKDDNNTREKKSTEVTKIHHRPIRLKKSFLYLPVEWLRSILRFRPWLYSEIEHVREKGKIEMKVDLSFDPLLLLYTIMLIPRQCSVDTNFMLLVDSPFGIHIAPSGILPYSLQRKKTDRPRP